MKTTFRKSFSRDLKKIKDRTILKRTRKAVEEVERASKLEEIANLSKLTGTNNQYHSHRRLPNRN